MVKIYHPHLCSHYGYHACIFCNKDTNMTSTTRPQDGGDNRKHLSYFWKDLPVEVAFYEGSFTAIDIDIQVNSLKCLDTREKGIIHEIRHLLGLMPLMIGF